MSQPRFVESVLLTYNRDSGVDPLTISCRSSTSIKSVHRRPHTSIVSRACSHRDLTQGNGQPGRLDARLEDSCPAVGVETLRA